MWVAACSWKMEAEADKTCLLGDSKEESEVCDKSRSLGEELELCDSKQVEVEVCDLKEGDRSCFLCDSEEDLELCNRCNLVVTCSHHVNLHR